MSKLQKYRGGSTARFRGLAPLLLARPVVVELARLRAVLGPRTVSSGVVVNESTALNYSAVWAAVTLISSQIGNLPLVLYKKDGKGKTRYEGHPLYRLIHDRPNPEMTSFALREVLQAHVLTWGNNYAEIERNGSGRPSALWPITPDRVTPFRRSAIARCNIASATRRRGRHHRCRRHAPHPRARVDGTCGYSVISKARESFGLGIATERFGSTFFGNGATFGGVISYPGPRPTELADKNYREALEQKHQGPERAHKLLALYNGAKYERMGIPPNDAQFLETRTFQIDEVARWFNLPPHKLKELARSTNNNIEQQNLEYYIDCLAPWLKRWEQELNEKLISPLERNSRRSSSSRTGCCADAAELAAARKIAQDAEEAKDLAVHERGQVAAELAKSQTAYEALVAARASERADFTGQIETLRSDLVTAQSLRDQTLAAKDVAEAARAALAVDLTRVQLLLETEQRDRIAERAEAVRHAGDLTTQIEALSLDVTVAQRDREAADALTQQVRKDLEQMTAQATSLGTDLITAQREFKDVFERNQVVEIDYEHVCQEKQALTTRAETTDAIVTELRTQLTEAMAAVAAGEMARAAAMADHDRVVSGVRAELAQVSETSVRVEGELRRSDEIAQAVIVELRTQVATLTAEGSTLTTALAEAKEQIGRAETVAAEAVRKLDAAETLATSHALAAKTLADQQVATKQALRGVLVDAVGLLVAKETHRARQSAGSPEKLAKWAEAFYPMHDDFCRTALRPAVRAWLVASGTDLTADQVLDRVVPSCIAESTRSLRGLVAETDSESLAPALERVLRRWDTERPEAIADRIMKESA
jgi:HK97 family phage portal protein